LCPGVLLAYLREERQDGQFANGQLIIARARGFEMPDARKKEPSRRQSDTHLRHSTAYAYEI